jgi:hypothetical protein
MHTWVITQGEGAVRTGTLSDAAGPVDLSQFDSVNVIAAKRIGATPVIDEAVTIDPDQVTNKGKFSFAFSGVEIEPLTYLLSFKGMNGATPTYFPLNRNRERTYGRLVVQRALG